MKFLTFLLTAVITARSAYAVWCNYGTGGNGGCEANGKHTYCCNNDNYQSKAFPIWRVSTVPSKDKNGHTDCTSGNPVRSGWIACA
ncbi:uncharacterized protein MYCFIDRAFT_201282 [Pseudocercospora fijiensis CIRAD86]|uniref:Hydrophobin n=1 Tax=Pseudocercospora fijiensis (strain CIRAD86) TaxID=383855 RepID=N1Q6C3_PSEFD|nr:uncharacterized protein MYCFIDRAFT_201282 [Pseudocercospora fijiensis CIRAD86]EME87829.1 hypothetical protein MYCFIDRAFT_201282 [Pseudocercospora fijiensis CIRAD86]